MNTVFRFPFTETTVIITTFVVTTIAAKTSDDMNRDFILFFCAVTISKIVVSAYDMSSVNRCRFQAFDAIVREEDHWFHPFRDYVFFTSGT